LAAAEMVIAVADEGICGSVRRDAGRPAATEGAGAAPMVSRRDAWAARLEEDGGAGMPDTLCLRVDPGACKCERCDPKEGGRCRDWRVPAFPDTAPNSEMSLTLVVPGNVLLPAVLNCVEARWLKDE
jgi:hypothetical protein